MVTPGTLTEETLLNDREENLLCAVAVDPAGYGLAALEISSGRFFASEFEHADRLAAELDRLSPAELVLPEDMEPAAADACDAHRVTLPAWQFEIERCREVLQRAFATASLTAFGCDDAPLATRAAGAVLRYASDIHGRALAHVDAIRIERGDHLLRLDAVTRRNLEIEQTLHEGQGTALVTLFDHCLTGMGARLLCRWFRGPLRDHDVLRQRNRAIGGIIEQADGEGLRQALRQVGDMERILSRVALRSARPRDLTRLADALRAVPALKDSLSGVDAELLAALTGDIDPGEEVAELIERAIDEEPAATIRDGGVIRDGFDATLDEFRDLKRHAGEHLVALEASERERTGMKNLKVHFNRVHGYYIELPRSQSDSVPDHYRRRQTLKNAERFITPELKEFEDRILGASEKALAREKALYEEVLDRLAPHLPVLTRSARALASVDVLTGLASAATQMSLSAPEFTDQPSIHIRAGRHPVVAAAMGNGFIANDLSLDAERRMLVVTGPNMGGKSTYMRQAALIVLLAHTGSYVPASEARLGPVDQVFTRIGASDDLASGRSTFMVEMTEMAYILRNASDRSLVLVDEIGRGTSTFDGLALAWACAGELARRTRSFTLFSTHYFELTQLADELDGARNVHLDAVEHDDDIVFLYAVQDGPASQSYGIQVARLAGVPRRVLAEARAKLDELEWNESRRESRGHADQLSLFAAPSPPPAVDAVIERLRALDPDGLTPREALEALYELRRLDQD